MAGVIFTVLNTVSEAVYPGYSVGANALSDLGAVGAPTRLLWDGQLVVSGIIASLGVVLLFRAGFIPRSRAVRGVYLAPNVATVVVGLVPENTVSAVHVLAAFTVFVVGGLAAVYTYRLTSSPFRYLSVCLGLLSLAATPLLSAHTALGFGGAERLVVYPFIVWGIAFGSYLMGWAQPQAPAAKA